MEGTLTVRSHLSIFQEKKPKKRPFRCGPYNQPKCIFSASYFPGPEEPFLQSWQIYGIVGVLLALAGFTYLWRIVDD